MTSNELDAARQALAAGEARVVAGHVAVDAARQAYIGGTAPRGAWLAEQRRLGRLIEGVEVEKARLRRLERDAAAAAGGSRNVR